MAIDFVHTEEVVDAVIAVLKGDDGATHTGGLPDNWFEDADDVYEVPLELLEHGDLSDYPLDDEDFVNNLLPGILVRGLGPQPTGRAGSGGALGTEEVVRVVHIRRYNQCRNSSGGIERNMTKARERYAKTINKALFNDPHKKLATIAADTTRTEVSLTCSDSAGAQLYNAVWNGWDLGHDIGNPNSIPDVQIIRRLPAPLWAIACDMLVMIRTGGE